MPDKNLHIKPGMSSEEIAQAHSDYLGLPLITLKDKKIGRGVIDIIPKDLAISYHIIAYELTKATPPTLKIAVADPEKLKAKAPSFIVDLKKNKGYNIELAITTPAEFDYALKFYQKPTVAPAATSPQEQKSISLTDQRIPDDVLNKFPRDVAEKYQIVIFAAPANTDTIKVAALHPEDMQVKEILKFIEQRNNVKIEVYQTSKKDLDYALRLYQQIQPSPTVAPENVAGTIPLAKPIPEVSTIKEDTLPPLQKQQSLTKKYSQKEPVKKPLDKPTEVKSEEVQAVELHEDASRPFVSEEEEKNLDNLLPAGLKDIESLAEIIKSGVIPKIVAAIIYLAVDMEASDIHLEPKIKEFRLRYRIDGILRDIINMPLTLHPPILSRIKILSKLKIDEQRVPQDGRFDVKVHKKEIDLRVSTLPTVHGEKAVLRILDKSAGVKNLEDLGFTGTNLTRVLENIAKPYGIVLATGPTGSGKSTTLYAILNKISKPDVNIITLEDPVEYEISGINQCQIRPKIGFGFAEGLRSILRQDPNIIMVGEIRDTETASMATHAALTGHLVLSTLHTNDASGALPRLINMGIEPFLITSAINCIIAQRLVRKICTHCKEEVKIPEPTILAIKKDLSESKNAEVLAYKDKSLKFYKGKGCAFCNHGYKGRIGIYEVLPMTAKIEEIAVHKRPSHDIFQQATEEKMITIKQDGLIKALKGLTSLDEILRATSD